MVGDTRLSPKQRAQGWTLLKRAACWDFFPDVSSDHFSSWSMLRIFQLFYTLFPLPNSSGKRISAWKHPWMPNLIKKVSQMWTDTSWGKGALLGLWVIFLMKESSMTIMKSNERAYKLVVCLSIILLYFLSGMRIFWAPIGGLCLDHSYKQKSTSWGAKEKRL